MAGANSFYSPPTPLKVCQGPAHTAQRCSVSRQALTSPPPSSARLPVTQRLRLLPLYGGISDVLQELFDDWDNDGGRRESSQHFSATHKTKKRRKRGSAHPPMDTVWYLSCQSDTSSPPHVNQNYSPSAGLSPGGDVRQHVSPAEQPFHAPA